MDVYKTRVNYDGSTDKLRLKNVVRNNLQNKKMIEFALTPTASTKTLKYILSDSGKHKSRVH